MAIHGLQTSGTITEGTEFTITSVKGTYRIADDATIANSAATITFTPGLDSAVVDGQGITFPKSTLTPQLEGVVTDYIAGLCCLNIGVKKIADSTWGDEVTKFREQGTLLINKAKMTLARIEEKIRYCQYPR